MTVHLVSLSLSSTQSTRHRVAWETHSNYPESVRVGHSLWGGHRLRLRSAKQKPAGCPQRIWEYAGSGGKPEPWTRQLEC